MDVRTSGGERRVEWGCVMCCSVAGIVRAVEYELAVV
jgi:hypothetical protein